MSWQSLFVPCHTHWGKKSLTKEKTDDIIGVEFENETYDPFETPQIKGWGYHEEGSLRNFGFEYVLKSPKSREKLVPYIDAYFQGLESSLGSLSKLINGRRTSTHLHFDVTRWNFVEILTASCLYWLLEPLLIPFCGEHRRGNHFCLGAKDSLANISSLRQNISLGSPWNSIAFSNEFRYASVNLASVAKFGSLEFRLMRGLSDKETFWTWLDILNTIRLASLKFSSPRDLYAKFLHGYSAHTFAKDILGEELFNKLRITLPKDFNIAEEIRDVFVNLTPLMLTHKDWLFEEEIAREKVQEERYKVDMQAWQSAHPSTLSAIAGNTINFGVFDEILTATHEEDDISVWDEDEPPYIPDELEEDL